MPTPPFMITRCSWPRPAVVAGGRWASAPEWGAPLMPAPPPLAWREHDGLPCLGVDWCALFGVERRWDVGHPGEMRGFHIVFELLAHRDGALVCYDDDGSIVRRDGQVIREDRAAHPPRPYALPVRAGERLEVAQWQAYGEWTWAARLEPARPAWEDAAAALAPYAEHAAAQLARPNGPPLKVLVGPGSPARSALAIYSLLLNGYRPPAVLLYGEHDWLPHGRDILARLLPFAQVVPTARVCELAAQLAGPALADLAWSHWYVLKACIALLAPPFEQAMMDDDVFVLAPTDDALAAFARAELVYAQDTDHGRWYFETWGRPYEPAAPPPTARFNAGLWWLRNGRDRRALAAAMLRLPPAGVDPAVWEQGLIATELVDASLVELPTQRYLFPAFDGLPGGALGYDYAANPCGLTSVHFGGLAEKPDDAAAHLLADAILARRAARELSPGRAP